MMEYFKLKLFVFKISSEGAKSHKTTGKRQYLPPVVGERKTCREMKGTLGGRSGVIRLLSAGHGQESLDGLPVSRCGRNLQVLFKETV